MTQPPSAPSAELPIWKGRRGLIATVLCCVLAVPCAFGLWFLTERSTIIPACAAYARSHGMIYADFKLVGVRHASTVVCMLTQSNGQIKDVRLSELVSFLTDLWVGFAMSLEITVPAFAVLLALARVAWYKRATRAGA